MTKILIIIVFFHFGVCLLAIENKSEEKLIQQLINVKNKGDGNQNASEAWQSLSTLPSTSIPKLLLAMNSANPLGDNWIRSLIEKIIENSGNSIPLQEIKTFLEDRSNSGEAREEAFQLISHIYPQKAKALSADFIDDPVISLRRKAVSKLLIDAKNESDKTRKIKLYQRALNRGRDVDQIKLACNALENAGQKIDLQSRMGFLVDWHTIGPFENTDRKGFNIIYSPEKNVHLTRTHEANGGQVKWSKLSTEDPFGLIDLNLQYGEIKEVLAYAHTNFRSETEKLIQLRIGSKNAWKLWLNGNLLFARDEYHRGKTRVDQFVINGKIERGDNSILVKVCQNEQTQSWTKQWEFCIRITDKSGTVLKNSSDAIEK